MQHTPKMADKIARQEGHRQVFVEYLNEIHNSRDASFLSDEDLQKLLLPQYSALKIKILF